MICLDDEMIMLDGEPVTFNGTPLTYKKAITDALLANYPDLKENKEKKYDRYALAKRLLKDPVIESLARYQIEMIQEVSSRAYSPGIMGLIWDKLSE